MTIPSGEVLPDSAASVRLHITPLDPDLIKVVLSSALLPKATNISYHNLETFPEKRYGFLELPAEDAEKIKKKLNGAVVKGQKIRIQTARPASLPAPLGEAAMAKSDSKKKPKTVDKDDDTHTKMRKRDVVLEGAQLEEGRKVKRGWTAAADEPQDKDRRARKEKSVKGEKKDKKEKKARRQEKSKFTDHAECLVKTILPPTAVAGTDADAAANSKSKKKKNAREVVVHEFEKTTKFPTFLKTTVSSTGSKAPVEFVDGKGWVDETGAVVEPVKTRPVTRSRAPVFQKRAPVSDSSSGGTDDSDDSDEGEAQSTKASPAAKADKKKQGAREKDTDTSDQPDSSSASPQSDTGRPKSTSSPRQLSIKIPPATPKDAKVHPLEALYKRPAHTEGGDTGEPEQGVKGFSFFDHVEDGGSDGDGDEDEEPKGQVLMTPFTRRDIETRGIRSAAPTPDTAHPSRRFKPWEQEDDDIVEDGDEDEEMGEATPVGDGSPSGKATQPVGHGAEAATSDFQKWFWENRGDINRSWKKRRKQAGKEKRYRENRARMARAI